MLAYNMISINTRLMPNTIIIAVISPYDRFIMFSLSCYRNVMELQWSIEVTMKPSEARQGWLVPASALSIVL